MEFEQIFFEKDLIRQKITQKDEFLEQELEKFYNPIPDFLSTRNEAENK